MTRSWRPCPFQESLMSETTSPVEFITITQDGKEREIHMTFGLLNEVTRLIGDPANAVAVYYNPSVREVLILTLLHERDERGKIVKEVEALHDVGISISETEELLAWGVEHTLAFFERSMTRVVATKPQLEKLGALTSSLSGSPASASKKASAGRSK